MPEQGKLIQIISEILGVEEELVTKEASLIDDLGAESIDFVDLCYQLEKRFKIGKVAITDIYPSDIYSLDYSEQNLDALVQTCPYLGGKMRELIIKADSFQPVRTVQAIEEFLLWRMKNAA